MKSIRVSRGYFAFTFCEQECIRYGEQFATLLDFYEPTETCLILLFEDFRTNKHDNGLREISLHALDKQYT